MDFRSCMHYLAKKCLTFIIDRTQPPKGFGVHVLPYAVADGFAYFLLALEYLL